MHSKPAGAREWDYVTPSAEQPTSATPILVANCGILGILAGRNRLVKLIGCVGAALVVSLAGAAAGFSVRALRVPTTSDQATIEPLSAPTTGAHAAAPLETPTVTSTAKLPKPASCPVNAHDPEWLVVQPPEPVAAPIAPKSLERRIAFWTKIWGDMGDGQHQLVDQRRPWIVHASIDCRDLGKDDAAKNACGGRITKARRDVQAKLKKNWSSPATLKLYDGNKKLAKTAAASIIGVQGRKDALTRATARAAPHLGHTEGLFEAEDVPRIYARAAIVESLWRPEALSRSGAAGAYQFMPKTGAQFLLVNEGVVDERLDPYRAAWAAARYMSQMKRDLKEWPLVLTAYNTGPARLKKVMKVRRTQDLGKIADAGDYGEYGFDGQNYYAQIVAIGRLTAKENFEPQAVTGRAVRLSSSMPFVDLAACLELDPTTLARDNPALAQNVVEGREPVPAGYVARVSDAGVATALK